MAPSKIIPKETPYYSTPIFRPTEARRRTPSSFSSSSSSPSNSWDSISNGSLISFSFNEDHEVPPYSSSPNNNSFNLGIPFSWEEIPGIPKHQLLGINIVNKKKESLSSSSSSSGHLLPLPPPAGKSTKKLHKSTNNTTHQQDIIISPKKHHHHIAADDPFVAALVECSKDDDDDDHHHRYDHGISSKITRSLSERFGLMINMYSASCKSTCTVSESSHVSLPKSATSHYLHYRPRGSA